ncbi:MAG: hypothetical protein R3F34_09535 [Planctomycetota bacterium]
MKHHVPTIIAIVLTSITVAVLSTCRGPAPHSVSPTPAQQTPVQDPTAYFNPMKATVEVTGDIKTITGDPYTGDVTLRFKHKDGTSSGSWSHRRSSG